MSATLLWRAARDAVSAYGRNPFLLVPALVLFLVMAFFKELSERFLLYLQTYAANVVWSILAILLQLAILAVAFSALLALATDIAHHRSRSLARVRLIVQERFLSMWILLLISLLATMIVFLIALGAGNLVEPKLGGGAAILAAVLVWIGGMAGGVVFLAFSNAYCVVEKKRAWKSICASAALVKVNYFSVLFVSAILLGVAFALARLAPDLVSELINTFVILPMLALFLVYFLKEAQ